MKTKELMRKISGTLMLTAFLAGCASPAMPANSASANEVKAASNSAQTGTKETITKTVKEIEKVMMAPDTAMKMVTGRFEGIIQKIEYAYDDKDPHYKGEALKKGFKVVFEINARTGEWSKWDVSNDNSWDDFAPFLNSMITIGESASEVIVKSGKTDTFIQKIDFLWDDSEPLYQGEAFNLGVKYSFEIYAKSGEFKKFDISKGDETFKEKYQNVKPSTMIQLAAIPKETTKPAESITKPVQTSTKATEPSTTPTNTNKDSNTGGDDDQDDDKDDDKDDSSSTAPSTKPETKPATKPAVTTAPATKPATQPVTVPETKPSTTPETKPATKPVATTAPVTKPSEDRISAASARSMVASRFGGIIQKIEYAYDETNPHYKGEALKDGYKVVFELNARTGSWSKCDVGNDNSWDDFAGSLSSLISMNEAANMVISRSGQSNTFVQKIDFLWDDSEPLYQGEAFNQGVKYSFEIHADSGTFKKFDRSTGDETWSEKYYNVR